MTAQLLRRALPAVCCARWLALIGAQPTLPLSGLPMLDAGAVLQALRDSELGARLQHALGPAPQANLSQSWLRHGVPAHRWHQDGALRFDFIAHAGRAPPADALLSMRTCWIALTPCGADAPGLEWVDAALPGLLQPAQLTDEAVAAAFAGAPFVAPRLRPGDAVLFDGALLHRTHSLPSMTRPRRSLELRFFAAGTLPPRVAGDRFLSL